MGELDKAIDLMERAVNRNPKVCRWNQPLAAAYAHLGQDQKAKAALDRMGYFLLRNQWYFWPFKDPIVAKRFTEGLQKAGAK
jgi:predicted Zn-dependent protease